MSVIVSGLCGCLKLDHNVVQLVSASKPPQAAEYLYDYCGCLEVSMWNVVLNMT